MNDRLSSHPAITMPADCPAGTYLPTLLLRAERVGLWQATHTQQIYSQLTALLAHITARYTMEESSSVPAETASGLLASVLYCIGLQLKSLPAPGDAAQALQSTSLAALWKQGKQLAAASARKARHLWLTVKSTRIQTPNQPYQYTLLRGIPPFFATYDTAFAAQDTPADIDYPACLQTYWQYEGVEFMLQYLQALLHENLLLRHFSAAAIHRTLSRCQPTYHTLPLNLFEPVLLCALGGLLYGSSYLSLAPSAQKLAALACHTSTDFLAHQLQQQCLYLCHAIQADTATQSYILSALQNALPQLYAAAQHGNVAGFFLAI